MSLRAWPADALEHELRSLRRFLRLSPECPDEVRINEYEGTFIRPSLRIVPVTSSIVRLGASTTVTRSLTIAWFGAESEDAQETEREARAAASWLTTILAVGDQTRSRTIRIYDYSNANSPSETRRGIDVDYTSIDVTQLRDDVGLYSVAADFRYVVRTDIPMNVTQPPVVTDIDRSVTITNINTEVTP